MRLTMPTNLPPSRTGTRLILRLTRIAAISSMGVSGETEMTRLRMTSATVFVHDGDTTDFAAHQ